MLDSVKIKHYKTFINAITLIHTMEKDQLCRVGVVYSDELKQQQDTSELSLNVRYYKPNCANLIFSSHQRKRTKTSKPLLNLKTSKVCGILLGLWFGD
jgi:hypothetical protein